MGETFANDLPAMQVVVPLLTAPVCLVLARWPGLVWAICIGACWTALAIAISLLESVLADGPISYAMGGWAAPWGIEYRIDAVNAYVSLIVTGIASLVLPFAYKSAQIYLRDDRALLDCQSLFPQPPPPGVSRRTASPGCKSRVTLPGNRESRPSRNKVLRPGAPGRPPPRP